MSRFLSGFVFWTSAYLGLYISLLGIFGLLPSAPVWQHVLIGLLAVSPFLVISQWMLLYQMKLQRRLSNSARTDIMTKLLNRRGFFEKAERILQTGDAVLLMVDVDHFKSINDQFGHATGDKCLIEMAKTLNALVGEKGTLGRLGGEEFAVLLPSTSLDAAHELGEAFTQGIKLIVDEALHPMNVTNSVGVASAKQGEDISTILGKADKALYLAKDAGRAKVAIG
jgi:diguanylate cyclase (GGDEF)-like protein